MAAPPPLLNLPDAGDYFRYFKGVYVRRGVVTHGGVRVSFWLGQFHHAFHESANRDGAKDTFSYVRAARMNWIRPTLTDPAADCYSGWNAQSRSYSPTRAVYHLYEDFVVVIKFDLARGGRLRASFVTCFQADHSMDKIKTSPPWDKTACMGALRMKKSGR